MRKGGTSTRPSSGLRLGQDEMRHCRWVEIERVCNSIRHPAYRSPKRLASRPHGNDAMMMSWLVGVPGGIERGK